MNHAAATTTLSRLLLSLAVAFLLGALLSPDVDANKNKGKTKDFTSIQSRNSAQRQLCEMGGGSLSVEKGSGDSMITECIGGDNDGYICTNSKKSTVCVQTLTTSPAPLAGGGGAVPPSQGGNEDPAGGGANPGAGGGIDPGWGAEPGGSEGGGVVLTSFDGGQHDQAKHDGKRKHRRHGNKSR